MVVRRSPGGLIDDDSGQGLVEFALVISLLFLLLAGVAEFGGVLHAYISITQASREGARMGALGASDVAVTNAILRNCQNLEVSAITVNISPPKDQRESGDPLTVVVQYQPPLSLEVVKGILGHPLTIRVSSTMRIE